jgi:hypothetical protein
VMLPFSSSFKFLPKWRQLDIAKTQNLNEEKRGASLRGPLRTEEVQGHKPYSFKILNIMH